MDEFKSFEASLPADEALPETFRELHTEYGALKQSGTKHQSDSEELFESVGKRGFGNVRAGNRDANGGIRK